IIIPAILYSSDSRSEIIVLNSNQYLDIEFQTEPPSGSFTTYDYLRLSLPRTTFSLSPLPPNLTTALSINGSTKPPNNTPFITFMGQSLSFTWASPTSLYTGVGGIPAPSIFEFDQLIDNAASGIYTLSLQEGSISLDTDLNNINIGVATGPAGAVTSSVTITGYTFRSKSTVTPISSTSKSLFPLIPNSIYTYIDGIGIPNTETIQDPSTFNGRDVIGIIDNEGFIEYFSNDGNGLFTHGTEDTNNGNRSTLNPPIKVMDGNPSLGQKIDSSGTAIFMIDGDSFVFNYDSSNTVVGTEMITVAAGSFEAVKLQSTISLNGIISSNQIATFWYVEDIGLVREEINIDGETTNNELVSFSIPVALSTEEVEVPLPLWSILLLSFFLIGLSIKYQRYMN
ncbi:MAG: hypothetical protein AAGB35_08955, partial [Pseudomonadota bacterium]